MIDEKKLDALYDAVKDIKPRVVLSGEYPLHASKEKTENNNTQHIEDCLYANVSKKTRDKLVGKDNMTR